MLTTIESSVTWPLGLGGKINKKVNANPKNHLVSFIPVKNSVVFANPNIHSPFSFKEGCSTPLGLFTYKSLRDLDRGGSIVEPVQALECASIHHRSALVKRIIFSDREGQLYRDIDIKGCGAIKDGKVTLPGELTINQGRWGLTDYIDACDDMEISERLIQAGIRTHRVLAIIKLEEIVASGKRISLEEARHSNLIGQEDTPVLAVRGFGTRARLADVLPVSPNSFTQLILEDGISIVSQEMKNPDLQKCSNYLSWFATTLGENCGLLHKNGLVHNFLSTHNITLDCRIVDHDSVEPLHEHSRIRDIEWALDALANFSYDQFRGIIPAKSCLEKFIRAYETSSGGFAVDKVPDIWAFVLKNAM